MTHRPPTRQMGDLTDDELRLYNGGTDTVTDRMARELVRLRATSTTVDAARVREAVIDAVDWVAVQPRNSKSSWALDFTEAVADRVAEQLAGRAVGASADDIAALQRLRDHMHTWAIHYDARHVLDRLLAIHRE